MPDFHNDSVRRLFKAISMLETPEECAAFFEDLCTVRELLDMGQRLDTAILLDQGMVYQAIAEKASVSTATISRVSRCLSYGSGGYKVVLERLKEEENDHQ